MTQDVWLREHPYLRSVAEFRAHVEEAVSSLPTAFACIPNWYDYARDFRAGVPLLRSSSSQIDLKPVATLVESLLDRLASTLLPDTLAQAIRGVHAELRKDPRASQRAVTCLLNPVAPVSTYVGLLRFLGWTVMARYLSKVVDAFGRWREEEHWLRTYCPTCGSLPAMAQLVGVDPGRLRFLYCGCCGTRWRYRRAGCPFCENDDHRLAIVAIEGEGGLRIDYCESCRGYIKTYNGSGDEGVLLADWTSLHLDIMARDRGLNRLAASLYEM